MIQSSEEIINVEGSAVKWSMAQHQALWLVKQMEANQHSLINEAFRHSVITAMSPLEHVTTLRSQFLSEHPSTRTKRSNLYCDGKNVCTYFIYGSHYIFVFPATGDSTLSI